MKLERMKPIIGFLLAIGFFLSIFDLAHRENRAATMALEDALSIWHDNGSSGALHFSIRNDSDTPWYYFNSYQLYQLQDENDNWRRIMRARRRPLVLIGYNMIMPGEVKRFSIQWWSEFLLELDAPGSYAFVMQFSHRSDMTFSQDLRIEFYTFPPASEDRRRSDFDRSAWLEFFGPTSTNIMQIGEAEIIEGGKGISFQVENMANYTHFFDGNVWSLVRYTEGQWQNMDFVGDITFRIAGMLDSLRSGEIREFHVDWYQHYGKLAPGRYMIVQQYECVERSAGSHRSSSIVETVFIPFEIKETQ